MTKSNAYARKLGAFRRRVLSESEEEAVEPEIESDEETGVSDGHKEDRRLVGEDEGKVLHW